MTYIRCDRCGEPVEACNDGLSAARVATREHADGRMAVYYDLCAKCTKELVAWIGR